MITKQQKKEIIDELVDKLSRQKSVVFADYAGLEVNQVQELRCKLRENNIDYKVARKTLIDLALKQAGFDGIKTKDLNGQLSMTVGYDDEVTPAKIIYEFAKKNDDLKILAGLVQGEYMNDTQVVQLAKLPSRQELLAKVVGSVASPMSGLLNAMQGNLRSLVYILSNIKKEV
ncbi:MAG: 50S ribosomal protein L10 [bacterium]